MATAAKVRHCIRGRVRPSELTKLRLFAASAGFCQNPGCREPLFVDTGPNTIHIAEMAHVFAASDGGPRENVKLTPEARAEYENLIMLCPNCHTIIDKDEGAFPDNLLRDWKAAHGEKISELLDCVSYPTRQALRASIEPLLRSNRAVFLSCGPDNEYSQDPESELAAVWQRRVLEVVIPNNRLILTRCDRHIHLLSGAERDTLERFRQHVADQIVRHIGAANTITSRFPVDMNQLLRDDDD